jgi:LysR family nod box-dependent transcriptional activator
MRLNRLDLNLLITLDALLTERSITRAAEKIYLSQSGTSGALARLREVFEDELLVRVGAQMQPTPLGESLQVPIHNILLQIQATVDRRLEFDADTAKRRFRLLMSDYTSNILMTRLVERIAESAPGIELEMIAPTKNPAEQLEQGEIDFLVMPTKVLSKDHPSFELFEEKFVCMCWNENPLANKEFTLKEFLEAGHVSVRFGPQRSMSQDQILLKEEHGIEPRTQVITSTFASLPQFINGTDRICTVYHQLARLWVDYLPLKILPMPIDLPKIHWGIQWHKYRELDPGIQWLRGQMMETAKDIFNQA